DAYNDELPYWVRVPGSPPNYASDGPSPSGPGAGTERPHLVVPYSLTTNDSKFGRGVFGSGEDFFAFLARQLRLALRGGCAASAQRSRRLRAQGIAAGLERSDGRRASFRRWRMRGPNTGRCLRL